MRSLVILSIGGLAFAFTALQVTAVKNHAAKLEGAGSVKLVISANFSDEGSQDMTLTLSKPNLMKLETLNRIKISDGKTIWDYDKVAKTYTEAPFTEAGVGLSGDLLTWAWAPFFEKNVLDSVTNIAPGEARKLKGNPVKESKVTLKNGSSITLLIDDKLGVARGAFYTYKKGSSDVSVTLSGTELTLGAAMDSAQFAFAAPAGAKKVDPNAVPEMPTFKDVQPILSKSCMPCHSAQNRKAGVDLSSYDGTMAIVTAGDANSSKLIHVIKSGKMPPNGKLPDSKIETIGKWINGGAKQ